MKIDIISLLWQHKLCDYSPLPATSLITINLNVNFWEFLLFHLPNIRQQHSGYQSLVLASMDFKIEEQLLGNGRHSEYSDSSQIGV
jgi:hypothetical protein